MKTNSDLIFLGFYVLKGGNDLMMISQGRYQLLNYSFFSRKVRAKVQILRNFLAPFLDKNKPLWMMLMKKCWIEFHGQRIAKNLKVKMEKFS